MYKKNIRVLVVEDDLLMFMAIENLLLDEGYAVVGPVQSLEAAVDAIRDTDSYDVALLDLNLAGEAIDPVAHIVQQRGIPAIFSSGYDRETILARWPWAMVVPKPWRPEYLLNALALATSRVPARVPIQIGAEMALKAAANIAAEILALDRVPSPPRPPEANWDDAYSLSN